MTSTPIAQMVRKMLEMGIAHNAIVMAVEGAETAAAAANSTGIPPDSAAEKRRAYDRERKRKSTGIPPESTGTPRNSETASSLKEERLESKDLKKEGSQRTIRGSRMLPDWKPDPDEWQATVELIGGQRAQSELLKFRDYWIALPSAKGLKADWPATWRNWIRRITESTGAANGNRPHNANSKPAGNAFFDGLRSLAADIAGDDQPPRDADPEIPCGRVNIDG